MARKSRGEIETGFVDFHGGTSAPVTFDLKATGEPRFTSPPVVKLACIERVDHVYRFLLFDRKEHPVYEYASGGVTNFGPGQTYASNIQPIHTKPTAHTITATRGGIQEHNPYQNQYIQINPGQTVGFNFTDENRSQPADPDEVYLYFQLWFHEMAASSGLQIGFMSTDSSNFTSPGDLHLNVDLDTDFEKAWDDSMALNNVQGVTANRNKLPDHHTSPDQSTIIWARCKLTNASDGSGKVKSLRGFSIKNTGTDGGEGASAKAYIANPIVVYGDTRTDGFTFNPNTHVSFSNVTTTGMTVECSAKLHGRVRFLMSV